MAAGEGSERDPSRAHVRTERAVLLLVLAGAAALRIQSLDFGLPHTLARPDETEIVTRALLFLTGDLHPRFFHYGTLYFYLVGAVYAAWAGLLALGGQPLSRTIAEAAVDPAPFLLMARAVSVLAGVITVWALYRLGRALGGARTGLAAAVFLAVAPLHVRDAHFGTTDVTLTLFLVLTAIFSLQALREGRVRDYALAGLCSGLAVSTKYVGLVMPGVITVTWLLARESPPWKHPVRTVIDGLRDRRAWAFTGAMVAAFVVTSPYAVLDFALFREHFGFQLGHLAEGHGYDMGIGGLYHPRYTVPLGTGWPVWLAALGGAGLALRRRPREAAVLLSFPLLFYASTFTSHTLFLRYMLPVIPFVCLFAAFAAVGLADRVAPSSRQGLVLVVAVAALAAEPLWRDVSINGILGRKDTRVLAAEWLVAEAGSGTHTVYQTGILWHHPELPPPEVHYAHLELPRPSTEYAEAAERLATPASTPGGRKRRAYRRVQAEARRDAAVALGVGFVAVDSATVRGGVRPEYVVLLESDLVQYTRVHAWVQPLLAAEYEAVHRVRGASPGSGGWYDQHDAFFVPFARLGGVERPGPDVTVFRRRSAP